MICEASILRVFFVGGGEGWGGWGGWRDTLEDDCCFIKLYPEQFPIQYDYRQEKRKF